MFSVLSTVSLGIFLDNILKYIATSVFSTLTNFSVITEAMYHVEFLRLSGYLVHYNYMNHESHMVLVIFELEAVEWKADI